VALGTRLKYYFGEDIANMTLPEIRSRAAFLCGGYSDDGHQGPASGDKTNGIVQMAREIMSRTGRKEVPLAEILRMGV